MKVPYDNIVSAVDKAKEGVTPSKKSEKGEKSFMDILKNSISKTNELQKEAASSASKLASGEQIDIHNAMIAAQKADVSFRLMMEVRNKIVEAYHEITRMQV